jgi:predicted DNA-binding transcriptional regulator AlpA
MDHLPEFIEFSEPAGRLRTSKSALRRAWQSGRFPPPIRVSPRRLIWPLAVIEQWLAEQQGGTPEPNQTTVPLHAGQASTP